MFPVALWAYACHGKLSHLVVSFLFIISKTKWRLICVSDDPLLPQFDLLYCSSYLVSDSSSGTFLGALMVELFQLDFRDV